MANQAKVKLHKRFFGYGLMAFLWAGIAVVSGSRFFYFAFYAWLFLMMASIIVHQINTKKIYMQFEMEKTMVNAGEAVPIRYRIINHSFIPAFHVKISPVISKAFGYDAFSSDAHTLDSYEVKIIDRWLVCERRGFYTLGAVLFEATDALGMMTSQFAMEKPIELTVRPNIYPVKLPQILQLAPLGVGSATKTTLVDRSSIKAVRPYRPGDGLKDVHWKLSAKQSDLLIKEYTPSYENSVILWLDAHKDSYEQDGIRADQVVDLAASLCVALLKERIEVQVITSSETYFTMRLRDESDLESFLNFLTAFTPDGWISFESFMEKRWNSPMYLGQWLSISPVYSEKLSQWMSQSHKRPFRWTGYWVGLEGEASKNERRE